MAYHCINKHRSDVCFVHCIFGIIRCQYSKFLNYLHCIFRNHTVLFQMFEILYIVFLGIIRCHSSKFLNLITLITLCYTTLDCVACLCTHIASRKLTNDCGTPWTFLLTFLLSFLLKLNGIKMRTYRVFTADIQNF